MSLSRTIVTLAAVLALSAPSAVGAQTDAESRRAGVQQRQAELDSQIDVLEASNDEITRALDAIDADIAAQQSTLDDAIAARTAAQAAQRKAEADLAAARHDVELLQQAIREMAVASYIHPPTADFVQSLQATSFSDALLQRSYLDARAQRDIDLLDLLDIAEQTAAARARDVDAAAAEASTAVDAAAAALEGLRQEQARQSSFAAKLQGRIDASLAEAAVLADLDAELADQIKAQQAALIARIPPPPPPPPQPVVTRAPSTTTTTTVVGDDDGQDPTTTTTTRPVPPPTSGSSTVSLRTVQGITVNADIAADVDALLTAARADGVPLSGWGYRSSDSQIALRMQNCGTTSYDVWEKPASACSPPTAIPGRSMHEQGRAIDFTYQGSTITSHSNPGYQWLSQHGSSYGLFNLPSEPWHWSTNGS